MVMVVVEFIVQLYMQEEKSVSTSNLIQNVELWDGSSWSEVNDLNTARRSNVGCGSLHIQM